MNCSVAQTLEVIGEWWTPLIIRDLMFGVSRFDDFQSRLGISRNVLTERLARLDEQGIVTREAYQDNPPRYDYRLTEKGADLWRVMEMMRQWGDRWAAPEGSPVELVHRTCGNIAHAELICSECGEALRRPEITVAEGPGAGTTSALPEWLRGRRPS